VCYDLLVTSQNRRKDEDDVGHTSRFSSLFRVEVSQASVFESSIKTGGGVTRVVHVVPLWRLREDQVENEQVDATGYIRSAILTLSFSMYYALRVF
jgi:hypothetical protein